MWDGMQPCRLAVEELTRDAAWVVYVYGDQPAGHARGSWIQRRALVLPGGTLQWEGRVSTTKEPVTFTFTLAEDRTHLRGERRFHETWRVSLATLRPMAPTLDPSHSLLLGLDTRPALPGGEGPGGPASAAFDYFADSRPGPWLTGPALERFRLDRYRAAIPRAESEVRAIEAALGPMHLDVASALTHLAGLYMEQGRYAEAEPLHWRALAIQEEALGPTHPAVAASLANLATVLLRQHQLAEAQPLFERARQISLTMTHVNVALEEETYRGLSRQHAWSLRTYVDLLAALARERGSLAPPASMAFVVAEQVRLGAVQMALARAGARAVTGEASAATLVWQVEELRRRQRALWQQFSGTDTTPRAGGGAAPKGPPPHPPPPG